MTAGAETAERGYAVERAPADLAGLVGVGRDHAVCGRPGDQLERNLPGWSACLTGARLGRYVRFAACFTVLITGAVSMCVMAGSPATRVVR